ncbi:hypothetical protein [Actinoallomurus sp. NPDC050550]|uniref:hypothetical protein n=1 Tax=Actinoallomurus sp. NPDC050550 TaxID=3154937 RepID=UPI0034078AD1
MRYMRVGPPGAEIPVVLTGDGRHLDLRGLTTDIDGDFLGEIDRPFRQRQKVTRA